MGGGKFGQADHHYLNVGRIIGGLMVVACIVVTEIFGSVVELWRFLSALPAFWGIAVWAGILWRRCNGYGAWAGLISSALVWWITRDYFQLEFMEQVICYLSTGILFTIFVSLKTPALSEERLDRFYTTLHTPIGQEDKLRALGYEVRE
jgi:Na+/proline symporter